MDVPRARQIARPAWLNLRTTLGLLLFSLAFLAGQRALQAARTTTAVWAAASDLASGASLDEGDVVAVDVRLPDELLSRYVPAAVDVSGRVLTRPVADGELIAGAWVAEGKALEAGRALTLPLASENGVGGRLDVGDRVDVLATFDAGDVRARTVAVVLGAEIIDIVRTSSLVVEDQALVGVTVAVTPQQAMRLAFALRNGEIDVARVDDAGEATPVEPVRPGDFG